MKDNAGKLIIKHFPSDESLSVFQNIKIDDNLREDVVPRIKEEPITDSKNYPHNHLSVMFVVWNSIDMI
jgi:hypothetical protein